MTLADCCAAAAGLGARSAATTAGAATTNLMPEAVPLFEERPLHWSPMPPRADSSCDVLAESYGGHFRGWLRLGWSLDCEGENEARAWPGVVDLAGWRCMDRYADPEVAEGQVDREGLDAACRRVG